MKDTVVVFLLSKHIIDPSNLVEKTTVQLQTNNNLLKDLVTSQIRTMLLESSTGYSFKPLTTIDK